MHGTLVPSLGPQIYASAAPVSRRRQSSGEVPVWPTGDAVLKAADADTHGIGKRRSGAHLVRIRPGVAAPTGLMTHRVAHSGPCSARLGSNGGEPDEVVVLVGEGRVDIHAYTGEASRPSSPGRSGSRASEMNRGAGQCCLTSRGEPTGASQQLREGPSRSEIYRARCSSRTRPPTTTTAARIRTAHGRPSA